MLRWLALVLLVLNGMLFLWGWVNDAPLEPPLPPPPTAPLTLRLVGEPVPELPHVMSGPGESPDLAGRDGEALARPGSPAPMRVSPSAGVARPSPPRFEGLINPLPPGAALPGSPLSEPGPSGPGVSGQGASEQGLPEGALSETSIERVDPDLLPEALDPLPVVIPPVQEDEPGPVHQWRREQGGYGD